MSRRFISPRPRRSVPDFIIKKNGIYYLLKTDDILYFEDAADVCRCYSVDGQRFVLSLSFREVLSHVQFSGSFVRVHKWFVHGHYLKGIVHNDKEIRVFLTNGKHLFEYENARAGVCLKSSESIF